MEPQTLYAWLLGATLLFFLIAIWMLQIKTDVAVTGLACKTAPRQVFGKQNPAENAKEARQLLVYEHEGAGTGVSLAAPGKKI